MFQLMELFFCWRARHLLGLSYAQGEDGGLRPGGGADAAGDQAA